MKLLNSIKQYFIDLVEVCGIELRRIFGNVGVVLVFFVAGLGYPLIFNLIYQKENLENVPIAVVDEARCDASRRFIHKVDATPELAVCYECNSIAEAKHLMEQRKVNGIIHFPSDYGKRLASMQQATISLFCDMSSFLYYKNLFMGSNFAMLDEMKQIQFERYGLMGITGEQANELVTPIDYDDVKQFVPGGGFTSFLIPALLIMVIHQTIFFGVGMLGGNAREDGTAVSIIPERLRRRRYDRVVLGRALAYLLIYIVLVAIDLFLIPVMFNLPHIGHLSDLVLFFLPFLLAAIFFAITCSVFVQTRESGIVSLVFFSIVLLFLSGFAWPHCSMPDFWRYFSYLFPSTHAVQGFIRINTMGANLQEVRFEYIMLWLQTVVYFLTACGAVAYTVSHGRKDEETTAVVTPVTE